MTTWTSLAIAGMLMWMTGVLDPIIELPTNMMGAFENVTIAIERVGANAK